jgi:predicted aspartyl protease
MNFAIMIFRPLRQEHNTGTNSWKVSWKISWGVFIPLLLFSFMFASSIPLQANETNNKTNNKLSDPYRIMKRYFDAVGGLQRLKAETYFYCKGIYGSGGVTGTVQEWHHIPGKWRREVKLMSFTQSSGCNGTFAWEVDRNGKIKIEKNEEVRNSARVAKLMQEYAFMEPGSKNFSVKLKGLRTINDNNIAKKSGNNVRKNVGKNAGKNSGIECYHLRITNTVNHDVFDYYINSATFLLEKTVSYRTDSDVYIRYYDYRNINGVLRPIRKVVTNLPSGGKYVFQITQAVSNRTIESSRFEPPAEDVRDFRFLNGRCAENIPFEFKQNRIMLNVEVDVQWEGVKGRGKMKRKKWLLDSGANATVIDRRYAEALGLTPVGNFKGHGVHNTFYYSYVTGPPLKLPGLELNEQIIMATDIDGTGILGYDFLSRFITKIDFAGKQISFYDPETFQYTGTGTVVPAPLLGKDFTIPATVDGKYGGRWRLDLGATFTAMHYPFASENNLLRLKGKTVYSQGVGGVSKLRSVTFQDIEVAGYKIKAPKIAIPIQPMRGALLQSSLAGNIGNSVLRHFVLYLDYKNQRVIFSKNL